MPQHAYPQSRYWSYLRIENSPFLYPLGTAGPLRGAKRRFRSVCCYSLEAGNRPSATTACAGNTLRTMTCGARLLHIHAFANAITYAAFEFDRSRYADLDLARPAADLQSSIA